MRNVAFKITQLRALIEERSDVLFPYPVTIDRTIHKGIPYLLAAFHLSNLLPVDFIEMLNRLRFLLDSEQDMEKNAVKQDPDIRRKRQKVFIDNNALDNMSPSKDLPPKSSSAWQDAFYLLLVYSYRLQVENSTAS